MVHVAGGEGGSTRHDDDNRPVDVRDLLGGQQILISVAGVSGLRLVDRLGHRVPLRMPGHMLDFG